MTVERDGIGAPYLLKPGSFIQAHTLEKINMPDDLWASISPRATLHICGILMNTSPIHPKYEGKLIFGMYNAGTTELEIKLGARFVNVAFFNVEGKANPYIAGDKALRTLKGETTR